METKKTIKEHLDHFNIDGYSNKHSKNRFLRKPLELS
jgi:hypothetical protein